MARKFIRLKNKSGDELYPSTIVEKIENENGTAIKYADGTMICRHKKTQIINIQLFFGGFYYNQINLTFPAPFIENDSLVVTPIITQPSGIFIPALANSNNGGANALDYVGIRVLCNEPQTNKEITAGYIAVGNWKIGGGSN